MRLSWKLFCSLVTIAALALSLGGYALISSQYAAGLSREITSLQEENDLLRYALVNEAGAEATTQQLTTLARRMAESTANRALPFALRDADGTLLMASTAFSGDTSSPLPLPSVGQRTWFMEVPESGEHVLAAVASLPSADGALYLENQRSVADLYLQRDEQYRIFLPIEVAAVAAVGLLAALLARWILRPLQQLSTATRAIAAGDLQRRVPVKGDDELGALSQDFNHMAAQMQTHVEELTRAAQRQEDFIGAFAHEIKTPLTSIIGYADLLLSRPASPDQTRESAGYIFREGRRLEALSHKLLDIVVLDGQGFERWPTDTAVLLAQIGGALEPALQDAHIELTVQADRTRIPIDADLIEAACLNLIDNARKACLLVDEHKRPRRIALIGQSAADSYRITVADNGCGIPPDEMTRITEAFYMVDKSRSRAQGGAGLGLALCQRIVNLHGGTLTFARTSPWATTACIELPRCPAPQTRDTKEDAHERP